MLLPKPARTLDPLQTRQCWGSNEFGELGQGDTLDRGNFPGQMGDNLEAIEFKSGWEILSISVGYDHSCALVDPDDGAPAALCWGANYKGQVRQQS